MNDCVQRLGRSIKETREKLAITQDQLAVKSLLHRSYIGGVERGERNICIKNLSKIAAALNVNVSVLLKNAGL